MVNRKSLTDEDDTVALMDEDKCFDNKMGTQLLINDGTAKLLISAVDTLSFDSKGGTTRDLYVVVREGATENPRVGGSIDSRLWRSPCGQLYFVQLSNQLR